MNHTGNTRIRVYVWPCHSACFTSWCLRVVLPWEFCAAAWCCIQRLRFFEHPMRGCTLIPSSILVASRTYAYTYPHTPVHTYIFKSFPDAITIVSSIAPFVCLLLHMWCRSFPKQEPHINTINVRSFVWGPPQMRMRFQQHLNRLFLFVFLFLRKCVPSSFVHSRVPDNIWCQILV